MINAQWDKVTTIKDSIHGYINMPRPIVKRIVDHEIFQRLKGIEQTGMKVLYPSATHSRFAHSLGVYHLGVKAFACFRKNIDRNKEGKNKETLYNISPETWEKWSMLFQLACLLHDCGHAPFSHTLEFVYDLDGQLRQCDDPREVKVNKELSACFNNAEHFREDLLNREAGKVNGNPHERMSAYLIAKEYKDTIKDLVNGYMKYCLYEEPYQSSEPEQADALLMNDIEFMVRMVIGCPYDYSRKDSYPNAGQDNWALELQLRNCIIRMLNSTLDVDNLDYIVRDAVFSGYESSNIDLERLLNAFTITTAYRFSQDKPLHIQDSNFYYSVELEAFTGEGPFRANVSGECCATTDKENMDVSGNVQLMEEELRTHIKSGFLVTDSEFSALIDGNNVVIGPVAGQEKACLHIQGEIAGQFSGTIFGCDPKLKGWGDQGGELLIFFAYNKSTLSVLQTAIDARNYESMWIYAHHTTTYQNNFLFIYLYEQFAQYLLQKEEIPREPDESDFDYQRKCTKQSIEIYHSLISIFERHKLDNHWYYRSNDSDLIVQYKKTYYEMIDSDSPAYGQFEEFVEAVRQMLNRNYLHCLWKSHAEYQFYFRSWTKEDKKALEEFFRQYENPLDSNGDINYLLLSDDVFRQTADLGKTKQRQKKFWEFLKEKHQFKRFVYVKQKIKTKELDRLKTYIRFDDMTLRLSDIDLYSRKTTDESFCYFYFEPGDGSQTVDAFGILRELKEHISSMQKEREDLKVEWSSEGGAV